MPAALLTTGAAVHLRFVGDEPRPQAIRGTVVAARDGELVVQLSEATSPLPGTPLQVDFPVDGVRWQFAGALKAVLCGGPRPLFQIVTGGPAVCAERRNSMRWPATAAGLQAIVGEHRVCPVLNVSDEGLDVVTPAEQRLGAGVQLRLARHGESYAGTAIVVDSARRDDGRWRSGLFVPDEQKELRRGLQELIAACSSSIFRGG